MKIVVIGSGAREHAIALKLGQSELAEKVFVMQGNGGTENNVDIDVNDFAKIKDFCIANEVKLIFVGPEVPLAKGIVDYFENTDIKVFGPDKKAAQLESSKIFAKEFMNKYDVATAEFEKFPNLDDAMDFIKRLSGNCVVKYDGLAAGKGVFVCSSVDESKEAIKTIKEKFGSDANFIIEEKLIGNELSIMGVTDGKGIQLFMPTQDHKQLLDNDLGPNTGGMGAFTPVRFCDIKMMKEIVKKNIFPTMNGLKEENFNYKGIVYFGLMITKDGPKVLEYNARFGDPETQVILASFKGDLLKLVLATFDGTLSSFKMDFDMDFFVNVVLASGGYPNNYKKGYEINGLDKISDDTAIFHAGTKKVADKILTAGGRVLSVVAHGSTLDNAIEKVYDECQKISFKDVYYRKDIGKRENLLK